MKKTLLFISALVAGVTSFAQTIPNGNFETPISSNDWKDLSYNPSTTTTVTPTGGKTTAIVLTTTNIGIVLPGILVSSSASSPGIMPASIGGRPIGAFPVTSTPKALQLAVNYVPTGGDTASVAVELIQTGGTVIGGAQYTVGATSGWEYRNIPMALTGTATSADSIRITILSSSYQRTAGSVLKVDNLRFLSCQPDPNVTLGSSPSLTPNTPGVTAGASTYTLANAASRVVDYTFTVASPSSFTQSFGGITGTVSPLDSIIWNDKTQNGLSVVHGSADKVSYGGSIYCYSVAGTLPATNNTTYSMTVTNTAYGTATAPFVGTVTLPATTPQSTYNLPVDTLTITVGTPGGGGPSGVATLDESTFGVAQNVPNPFSGSTTIAFSTPNAGNVTFTVTDVLGRTVSSQTISASAGINSFTYSASDSGTYFYTLSNGAATITRKLVVSK